MEGDSKSSYDVFVSSKVLHYRLGEPLPAFAPYMKDFVEKMGAVKWVVDEITTGQFGWQEPQQNPNGLQEFLDKNTEMLLNVSSNWDFVYEKVSQKKYRINIFGTIVLIYFMKTEILHF